MNEAKEALRAALRKEAAEIPASLRREIDRQIVERLLAHPTYAACTRVFMYVGVRNEIYTRELIESAVNQGKIVALPVSGADGVMEFYRYDGNLKAGRFGISEPTSGERLTPTVHDLLIVPAVAFDCRGYRLGQGGGYYDRYMARYPCKTIGLCREKQLRKEIPVAWNDLAVEVVITENAVYEC